jgi:hypothetical protein
MRRLHRSENSARLPRGMLDDACRPRFLAAASIFARTSTRWLRQPGERVSSSPRPSAMALGGSPTPLTTLSGAAGQDRPVGPVRLRLRVLPPQHRHLLAQPSNSASFDAEVTLPAAPSSQPGGRTSGRASVLLQARDAASLTATTAGELQVSPYTPFWNPTGSSAAEARAGPCRSAR